jgi:hypothetical protein
MASHVGKSTVSACAAAKKHYHGKPIKSIRLNIREMVSFVLLLARQLLCQFFFTMIKNK